MKARGFTLIELIISITISAIVVIFAVMFISAPVDAYQAHSRRAVLVADTSGAWPRMETDLRSALPNSLRTRRNAANPNLVVLEMLAVLDVARYMTSPSAPSFDTAGVYRADPTLTRYLSVNNLGTLGPPGPPIADAYTLTGSMVPATVSIGPGPAAGENTILVTSLPVPVFTGVSPKHLIYFVSGPVTYLCDEGLGTLRRYENYTIAANQAALDSPAALAAAGSAGELITRGLTSCNFVVSPVGSATQSQTVAVHLTGTTNGDSVTLLHSWHGEYVP